MASKILATIYYNEPYAAYIHEETYNLGPRSIEFGPSSRKWLEKHLKADGPEFYKTVSRHMESGLLAEKILKKI